ncbi:MAG: hypothetical protein R3B09_24190 [Nannocystaceae bacterium]
MNSDPLDLTPDAPLAVSRAATQIARHPDVLGVYWGTRRREGAWTDEPCLSVEVERKERADRLETHRVLPSEVEGVAVDVVEVGAIIAAALSHDDLIRAKGSGYSTITCVAAPSEGRARALLSGHAVLPIIGGSILRKYPSATPHMDPVVALDLAQSVPGRILAGEISARQDFTVAEFDTADVSARHRLAEGPRIVARTAVVTIDERVRFYSTLDAKVHRGRVAPAFKDPITVQLGNESLTYSGILRVRPEDKKGPFATKGDSGGLVVDDQGRALGTIIAVSVSDPFAYVLPLYGLSKGNPDHFHTFFIEA